MTTPTAPTCNDCDGELPDDHDGVHRNQRVCIRRMSDRHRALADRVAAIEAGHGPVWVRTGVAAPASAEPPRKLADGWQKASVRGWDCTYTDCTHPASWSDGDCAGACSAHAIEMGVFAEPEPKVEAPRCPWMHEHMRCRLGAGHAGDCEIWINPPSAPSTNAEPPRFGPGDCPGILPKVPTEQEGRETVERLGIDVPAWASEVRAKVADAMARPEPPRADGQGTVSREDMDFVSDSLAAARRNGATLGAELTRLRVALAAAEARDKAQTERLRELEAQRQAAVAQCEEWRVDNERLRSATPAAPVEATGSNRERACAALSLCPFVHGTSDCKHNQTCDRLTALLDDVARDAAKGALDGIPEVKAWRTLDRGTRARVVVGVLHEETYKLRIPNNISRGVHQPYIDAITIAALALASIAGSGK